MDHWSVFTKNLRYTAPSKPTPGYDIQAQGCMDFSPDRVSRIDNARNVSMAPLDLIICQPVKIWMNGKG